MPKSIGQKAKILHIASILLNETDFDHRMNSAELIQRLLDLGISCDRKSVYDDISVLNGFGLNIEYSQQNPRGYYIDDRKFSLAELKLLIDAVQASRVISVRKSKALTEKIRSLANVHQSESLNRRLVTAGDIKTVNEAVYYTIDSIYDAIASEKQLDFHYIDHFSNGKRILRNEGALYSASPLALVWSNECYYMFAYYEKYGSVSSFRVDRMCDVFVTDRKRTVNDEVKRFDPSEAARQQFSMFSGETVHVCIELDRRLIGSITDRFGDASVDESGEVCTARFDAELSPAFLSWLFQFGTGVRIRSPEKLKDEMKKQLGEVLKIYN